VGAAITLTIGVAPIIAPRSACGQGTAPTAQAVGGSTRGAPLAAPLGAPMRPFDTTAYVVIQTMRAELGRLRAAQISFYGAHHRYAASTAELDLVPTHGTMIEISEADARSYHATATNAALPGAEIELYEPTPPPGMAEPSVAADTADTADTAGTAPVTRPTPNTPRPTPDTR